MKKNIDLLILNNCPAFYKINLYNEIAKHKKIFVVFLGYSDQVVIDENFKSQIQFPYLMLNEQQLGKRSVFFSILKLLIVVRNCNFEKIIFGGYTYPEFIIASFLTSKRMNVLQTESAGETKLQGVKYFLKRILLKRYNKALASGSIHEMMLRKMGFNKDVIVTKGVGLINRNFQTITEGFGLKSGEKLKFLYVGRLIDIKNVRTLIDVFNANGLALTIAGKGDLEEELKIKANFNITFLGFVDNKDLALIYKQHDIFILPSLSEPWGLVVEEALHGGCVLLLSDRVGSLQELLIEPTTGVAFNPTNIYSFQSAIDEVTKNYSRYRENVAKFDLEKKDFNQILAYTESIYRN